MIRKALLPALMLAFASAIASAQTHPAAQAARAWRQQHERPIVDELVALLGIPNIAKDRDNILRNADAISALMERRGLAPKLVSVESGNPIVFGEIRTPGATRTIVFYAHYDGQPVDPREWSSPPFDPVLRTGPVEAGGIIVPLPAPGSRFDPEWRLYARSAADDKAPIVGLLAALDAIRAAGLAMKSNVKFVFEGEEEATSINLERTLAANKALFAGDLWLMCDGPVHQTRRQMIAFGARGFTGIDVTVYGPRIDAHSGHYGNWAPNPALTLARLLVSMKDDRGHVLVDHFYDGIDPLTATEQRAIAAAPDVDKALMKELWLGSTDNAPRKLADVINEPSLNIRGMASGHVGNEASNVIPASAAAALDIRLVKGMDRRLTQTRVIDHIRKQGFFVVDREPTKEERLAHAKIAKVTVRPGSYDAVRTPMDLPIAQEVIRVVESARGPAILVPAMGGGLPLDSVERPLGTRTMVIPMANHDDNQHGADENLRIQNLWDGIELMAALLTM